MTEAFQVLLYAEDGTLLALAPLVRQGDKLLAQDVTPCAAGEFSRAVLVHMRSVELHLADRCLGPHVRLNLALDLPSLPERST